MTKLRIALGRYPHTQALREGTVAPAGVDLEFAPEPFGVGAFRTMVRELSYDVCELAITTYLASKEYNRAFTAIPVFPVRNFQHRALTVNSNARITDPRELEGQRVGVRAYTVTAGVWARGVLADQCGVNLDNVTWVLGDEEHVPEFELPDNTEARPGADLGELVSTGELAGGIGVTGPAAENVSPLLGEPASMEAEWFARGIYPINHTIVIRDAVLHEHPDVAGALYQAFLASKEQSTARLTKDSARTDQERALADRRPLVGADPLPYGIGANRTTLEALLRFARDQHIVRRDLTVEDLFVPGADG